MKKLLIFMMALLLAVTALVSCNNGTEVASDNGDAVEAVELPEGWIYDKNKIVGAWETQYELTGEYYGYRFNADGTLDELYNRMYAPMGTYECRIDGIHYSPDGGVTWDETVMVITELTDTELTYEFNGSVTTLTRYDGELTEYMPDGWTYVEGTDEEIDAATSAEAAE